MFGFVLWILVCGVYLQIFVFFFTFLFLLFFVQIKVEPKLDSGELVSRAKQSRSEKKARKAFAKLGPVIFSSSCIKIYVEIETTCYVGLVIRRLKMV